MSEKELNDQESVFVDSYLKTLSPYDSALEAKYSESVARSKAWSWVSEKGCPDNKIHVLNAVKKAMDERSERTKIDSDWVLQELRDIWNADICDIFDDNLNFKPILEWPLIWRKMINGIDVHQLKSKKLENDEDLADLGSIVKTKFVDKMKTMELIGKHINVSAFRESMHATGDFDITWGFEVVDNGNDSKAEN